MLKENLLFLREAITEFHHTGSIFPTSRWAAKALSGPLRNRTTPKKILELGPGNGSVTVKILEEMVDGDELTICEINPNFMKTLKLRLRKLKLFQERRKQIKFFCGAAQNLPEDQRFDVIICALPFLNFDRKTVEEIFAKIERISTSNTMMTYYEFIGIRQISMVISPAERKQRIRDVDSFFKGFYSKYSVERRPVWLNFTPINIYEVRLAA